MFAGEPNPISAGGVWNSCLLEENPHQLGNQGKEYVHTIVLFLIDQLLSFRLILLKLFCQIDKMKRYSYIKLLPAFSIPNFMFNIVVCSRNPEG